MNWDAVETMKGWSTEDQANYVQTKKDWAATDDPVKKKQYEDTNAARRAKYGVAEDTFGAEDAEKAYIYNTQMGNSYLQKGAALDFGVDKSGLNKAKQALENFSYNPEKDPAFLAYRDMAHREGESAAKSTLNQLNAASMGRNNSFSSAATAQVQQAYNQKVSDKAIELADIAYQKLLNKYNLEKAEYETELAEKQNEYNRYMDLGDRSMNRYVTGQQLESGLQTDEVNRRATTAGAVAQEKANNRYDEVVDAELEQMKANTQGTYYDMGSDIRTQASEAVEGFYEVGMVNENGMVMVYVPYGPPEMMDAYQAANLLINGKLIVDQNTGNLMRP